MCSRERRYGVNPEAPPTPCLFRIICGLLCSRLVAALTKHTGDGPRKIYMKEWRMYQQYMDDQEKQVQQEQKKFGDRLREAASISNIRERFRQRQYRVKQGSPPPNPPPYCPHWHKARPKPQKAWTKFGTGRLRVYKDGYVSRLERYEERLRDPTSKEARQKDACEASYSSTATTLCGAPLNPEAELVDMFERLWELKRWKAQQDELSEEEEGAGARQEQPEEDRAEMHKDEYRSTEGSMSWARSLGTVATKGKYSTTLVQRRFDSAPQSPAFSMGLRRGGHWQTFDLVHPPDTNRLRDEGKDNAIRRSIARSTKIACPGK